MQPARELSYSRTLCLYHYPCPDGIFAALALNLWHQAKGKAVEFIPNRVYAPATVQTLGLQGGEVVYLVDFAGPSGFAKELAQRAQRVVVLDHHKTSAAELTDPSILEVPNLEVHFDMNRSGATVAHDYFQPEGLTPEQQQLFKYIEDADLWRWRLPDSKAFHSGLGSLRLEYDATKNPGIFDELLAQSPESLIARGKPILEEERRQVEAAAATAFVVNLGGSSGSKRGWGQCLAVAGADDVGRLRSQLGNVLAERAKAQGLRGVAVVAYTEAAMNDPSKLKLSLRSVGDEDTTVISETYGGGGHKNASSFVLDGAEFETWRV
ncbi:hypothetical protein N2152v2_008895 [Parachlorella kessleri]